MRFLFEEAFLDLDTHFEDLFTAKWMMSSMSVDTICVTLEDYFHDYNHLTPKNFEYVINEAQNLVCKKYITAMLSRKTTFKTPEDIQAAAQKILRESNQMKAFFTRIAPELNNLEWSFETINNLAEVRNTKKIYYIIYINFIYNQILSIHKQLSICQNL